MIFRPRIFISSTFEDNLNLRKRIHDFFILVGAEPLLYEHELTPSTIPMTYRENIKDADFVVLIVKNIYGTKTDWDMSGTHEEYILAKENKIPMHVYLLKQRSKATPKSNPLMDDLKKDGISYYYFSDDKDLFKRLKQTTFTVAKEIMLNQVTKSNLPLSTVRKLVGDSDYSRAIEIVQIIEFMIVANKKYELDFFSTNIIVQCIEPITYQTRDNNHYFISDKLNQLISEMLKAYYELAENHTRDYTTISGQFCDYQFPVIGPVIISNLSYHSNSGHSQDDYDKMLQSFFDRYFEFKEYVQEIRTLTDLI